MNDALTHTVDIENIDFSIGEMIYEWLTRSDAFGSGASGSAVVTAIPEEFKQGNQLQPVVFYERVDTTPQPVGAGMRASMTKELITYRLSVKVDRSESFIKLKRTSDLLAYYFRNNNSGRSVLGKSGLRRAELTGPYSAHNDKFYEHNYFLRFKVTA